MARYSPGRAATKQRQRIGAGESVVAAAPPSPRMIWFFALVGASLQLPPAEHGRPVELGCRSTTTMPTPTMIGDGDDVCSSDAHRAVADGG